MSDPIIPPTEAEPRAKEQKQSTVELEVSRPEGKVEIDENLSFEVEVLAHEAASEISRQIVEQLKERIEPGSRIVFLDGKLAAAVSLHRSLRAQCGVLLRSFASAGELAQEAIEWLAKKEEPPVAGGEMYRLRSLDPDATRESAEATGSEMGVATFKEHISRPLPLDSTMNAAVNILSYLGVDESYSGRSVSVSERALVLEIARHCGDSFDFNWPSLDFVLHGHGETLSYLKRLNQVSQAGHDAKHWIHLLSELVNDLDDEDGRLGEAQRKLDQVFQLHESSSAIFDQIQETFLSENRQEGLGTSELADLGERVASLWNNEPAEAEVAEAELAEAEAEVAEAEVYFLTAQIEKAGGSYRTRRHLWQAITLEPPLTFSGGSIVSFAVLDKDGGFVDSATLSHQTGYQANPRQWTPVDRQSTARRVIRPFLLGVLTCLAALFALAWLDVLTLPEIDPLSLILGVAVALMIAGLLAAGRAGPVPDDAEGKPQK